MISKEKMPNALYALQSLLVHARHISSDPDKSRSLFELLDYAEYLPYLIANNKEETEQFHAVLVEVAHRYSCVYVLQAFENEVPPSWRG